jgi:hypothetical protein
MAPRPGKEVATLPTLGLTNLGIMFSELGRPADAMTADQEVVGIRRELAVAMPASACSAGGLQSLAFSAKPCRAGSRGSGR